MCQDCGCGDPDLVPIQVRESLLAANDREAAHNREHLEAQGVYAINLMGSPGAGKTAVLEALARLLGGQSLRAVSGDLATDNDGARLRSSGIAALTITTGQACHLDARLVHQALHELNFENAEYLFIENVGNLVCPAIYDLGQAKNVVVLSVTEGEDKPLKYPVIFRVADLVILSKVDLLPHLPGISQARIRENLSRVNPDPQMIAVSAVTGEGMDELADWLAKERAHLLTRSDRSGSPTGHSSARVHVHAHHEHGVTHHGRDEEHQHHGHGHEHHRGSGHDLSRHRHGQS
jgi:hydrogenase nickel incorporation protein HypB